MKMLRCKCCGGHIDLKTLRCNYCDTQYERDGDDIIPVMHEVVTANIVPIGTRVVMSDEMVFKHPEIASGYAKKELTHMIAEKIMEHAEMRVFDEPLAMQKVFVARVNIATNEFHPYLME